MMKEQNSKSKEKLKNASLRELVKMEHYSKAFEKTFRKGHFENRGSAHTFAKLLISSITIFLKMRSDIHLILKSSMNTTTSYLWTLLK